MHVPSTRVNRKSSHLLISQDPTVVTVTVTVYVDSTKPMHRNCLRAAIMDTYPRAHSDPKYTIQDLIKDAIKHDLCYWSEDKAATEEVL